ncbi:galactosyltransferase-related protein [Vibrio genomosp. F10 str. 9ZC157]|uniref:Glycosyl transferase n=1 Tax=Vibrio genomosp. F10 str. ZF-129 TaxID=1187848 RepID=A0A1E5BED3_9VIBR|nr:galactosyltransferase-related protein [Vibrio genomosp. F10]OEE33139.1 glycosyl transferase [Vibrio genomosp. F10 str. ZF-129]OEE95640.1 glycosyl transferase [Vibrio genomosp. F10 str. 9ZC157]
MTVYISIVNHHHDSMIVDNPTLPPLAKYFTVIIKSNTQATPRLTGYCLAHRIHLIQGDTPKGFGANNNEVFQFVKSHLNPTYEAFFLALNPDVEIAVDSVSDLIAQAIEYQADISTINLYTDNTFNTYDCSIRRYPSLLSPLKSLVGIPRSDVYDKSKIVKPTRVEWAAGSFLLFTVNSFELLNGFDERYFMYFEDADICTRANKHKLNVYYFPSIKAVHFASHQNRRLLSKHFIWYWKSSLRYQVRLRWGF